MNEWKNWFSSLDDRQKASLLEVLKSEPVNGIEIVRAPVEDFMYSHTPPYVDVFNLIPLYQKMMFQENLLVRGPKGDGKSLSIITLAALTQTPLITMPCDENTKKKDLIGSFYIKGSNTPFNLGNMATAIDIANEVGRAFIVFEEINALTPQVQKQLNEFLDFRRSVSIPQIGKTYRLRKDAQLWAIGLMNPSVYGGTYELNEDFRSRWTEVDIGYPTKDQEMNILRANVPPPLNISPEVYDKVIESCANIASQTRDKKSSLNYSLSTRDVVKLARLIFMLGTEDALQLLSHKFEGKDHELMIARISSTFAGAPRVKEKWNSAKTAG